MNHDDDDFELDPDLDSALDAWAQDFEQQAKAESAPMPQASAKSTPPKAEAPKPAPAAAPKSTSAARPLYRPDPELLKGREAPKRPAPAPPLEDRFPAFDDDDDDAESTKIASIPKELIASLQEVAAAREAQRAREAGPPVASPTPVPPAPQPSGAGRPTPIPGIDLDLDDLFDGLDAETRISELPARTAEATRAEPPPPAASERPQAPEEVEAEKSIASLETDFLDPFSDEQALEPVAAKVDPLPSAEPAKPPPAPPAPRMPPRPPVPAVPRPPMPPLAKGLPPRPPAPPKPLAPSPAAPAWKPPAPPAALGRRPDDVSTLERPLDSNESAVDAAERPTPVPGDPVLAEPARPDPDASEPDALDLAFEPPAASEEPEGSTASADAPAPAPVAARTESSDDDEPELSFDEPELSFEPPAGESASDEARAPAVAADDDEPELSFDDEGDDAADEPAAAQTQAHDDEPELSFDDEGEASAGDEGRDDATTAAQTAAAETSAVEAFGGDSGLTALAPPGSSEAPPPRGADPSAADAPAADQGAATAQRTVRQRKPRAERFAFVGRDAETQRRRAELLHELAARSSGAAKARLLTAAAELHERLGDPDAARDAYTEAHAADPTDVVVLRALRREALRRREFGEAADHLTAEAALPLGATDRAHALCLLAELQLVHLADPAGATESARRAHEERATPTSALLLLEAQRALGDREGVASAATAAAQAWPEGRAPLTAMLAAAAEREGRREVAGEAYAAAALPLTSGLGRARLLDSSARAAALAAVSDGLETASLREVFRRLVAITRMREDAAAARDAVEGATRPASLRARARAARLAGDLEARCTALESLARATGGTERAIALVELAEARADRGELDAAAAALRDAALADERLDTIRVVREVLSRRTADPDRFAATHASTEADETSSIALAARLAAADDRAKEREVLELARERGESPLAAELAMLDAAAESGATEAVVDALRRHAERLPPDRRAGSQLALSSLVDGAPALDALRAAAEANPAPVTTRALARALSGADAAAVWEQEAERASGESGYHAWVQAGRAHLRAGDQDAARRAFERAFDELPGPSAAAWLLELRAPSERGLLDERLLDVAASARAAASAAVRVALDRGDAASVAQALEHVERALTVDPALDAWAVAHVGMDPAALAALSEARATASESVAEKRLHLLRAAIAYEHAGDARGAAVALRSVRELAPDPLAANTLDRVELAAGEQTRVAERRFEALKSAETPEDRLVALEALAALDLHERDDVSSGVLTLRSILEDAPGHLPTLRALARYAMSQGDDEALEPVTRALALHLPAATGVATSELAAHARAASRLRLAPTDATGDAADELLRGVGERLRETDDDWLLRHLAAAANDDATRARWKARRAEHAKGDPYERAAELLDAAEAAELAEGPGAAALLLAPTAELLADDPITAERRGAWLRAAGEPEDAGVALRLAADRVGDPIHAVRLFYDAGRAFEDAGNAGAASDAYEEASRIDVRYHDLFERLKRLLEAQGDRARLAALVARRVEAGADTRTLVELHENRAKLALELGNRADAREAFKAALALDPQRVEALKRLATLQLEDSDWRGAAESLIRIARLRHDRDELRWVFFTLGDIYDRHLPEPKRAEAAFRRVLKLLPDDLEALDRLASLFEREGQHAEAIPVIEELLAKEIDPDEQHRHLLRLALAHERRGDPRSAEHVLDEARKKTPTDLVVLKAMADLYQRQNAPAALAMHLGRATGDFRRLVEEDATSHEAWSGLVEILEWKDRRDAARACASVAVALGVQDVAFGSRLDSAGGIPGAGTAAADPDLRDGIAPRMLNRTVFEVFRLAGEAFDKALPFDAKAWRAEKLPSRGPSLRDEALRAARAFGITDVQVLVTSAAPRLCVAVGDRPATILVGHDLAASTTEAERTFLFTRALAIVHAGLSVVMRSQPEAVSLLIGGLLKSIDPMYAHAQLDPKALEDMAKRVGKNVPRKNRDALVPLAVEMGGAPGFEPTRLGLHAAELGDRLALVALGAPPSAFSALLALAGVRLNEGTSSEERVASTKKVPEAWSLVRFAISDAHFDARHRAGADRL